MEANVHEWELQKLMRMPAQTPDKEISLMLAR